MRGSLVVRPLSAQFDRDRGLFNKMDPYCVCTIGKERHQTSVAKGQGKTPEWQDLLKFSFNGETEMTVSVHDKHKLKKDGYLGECIILLTDVMALKNMINTFELFRKGKPEGKINIALEFHPEGAVLPQGPHGFVGAGPVNHPSMMPGARPSHMVLVPSPQAHPRPLSQRSPVNPGMPNFPPHSPGGHYGSPQMVQQPQYLPPHAMQQSHQFPPQAMQSYHSPLHMSSPPLQQHAQAHLTPPQQPGLNQTPVSAAPMMGKPPSRTATSPGRMR